MANIPKAQSGEVPSNTIKDVPHRGPMEIAVIQFNRASSGLAGTDQSVLHTVAAIQRTNGGTVRIVAHASQDVSGSSTDAIERGNYEVSRRRALAIVAQLERDGVPRSAIIAEAASDSEPKYSTVSPSGIAANRRAEVFINF